MKSGEKLPSGDGSPARGFQVLLMAYLESRQTLDYDALELRSFEPGVLVQCGGRFQRLVDPWRRPKHDLTTASSSVGTLADKLRIAGLRRRLRRMTLEELDEQPEQTTLTDSRDFHSSSPCLRLSTQLVTRRNSSGDLPDATPSAPHGVDRRRFDFHCDTSPRMSEF